ncbi:sodium/glutamate symporter [Halioglobus japonicus]|uniref:Sodium/glutamate symporter n=1 Tax=Halioglobus japonicus TaxID=930805 RepID=A0AAP8MCW2_9GAMM|nr:sodium/glutamate symporter [Halioglobus japonicus]PLW85493.1 sodium/glutamate symporter [Halioglobus japonicus]GHD15938.1 sodium/glutamate symporter [Halioglobus japonicus]
MELDPRQTLIVAILVLYLGRYLNGRVNLLRNYNIPEPVTGGLLASLLFGLLYAFADTEVTFDMANRDMLLIVFFTTIGLSSRIDVLKQGGKSLLILLVLAGGYLMMQNLVGIGIATATGGPPVLGVLTGSVSLSGGHGTAIAWAPTFASEYGIPYAMEIGLACATFGLIFGGIIGGPIARFLVWHYKLAPETDVDLTVGFRYKEHEIIDVDGILKVLLVIAIAIGVGIHLNDWLGQLGLKLPEFVTCLFAGIILTNSLPRFLPKYQWPTGTRSLALVSDVSLGLFLAMSLMSLQLWALADLAGSMMMLLVAQVVLITLFSVFVVFRLLGANYDAAVMCSGYSGLALGATPTAIANMTAVTKSLGPAPRAFIVVPLVGAFFIDLCNAMVINLLLSWFG